jgi:hypothetical protein
MACYLCVCVCVCVLSSLVVRGCCLRRSSVYRYWSHFHLLVVTTTHCWCCSTSPDAFVLAIIDVLSIGRHACAVVVLRRVFVRFCLQLRCSTHALCLQLSSG